MGTAWLEREAQPGFGPLIARSRTLQQIEMAEIAREWVLFVGHQVEQMERRESAQTRTMFRVPPPLRRVKPDDFTPGLMHFGLFDRDLQDERVNMWRVQVATAFLEQLQFQDMKLDWNTVCNRVVPNAEEMLELYGNDVSEKDPDVVRYLLTLDAILLASYFTTGLVETDRFQHLKSVLFKVGNLSHVINFLPVDIMLLENQIPLSIIRNVLKILYNVDDDDDSLANMLLDTVCRKAMIQYSRSGSMPGSGHLYSYAEVVQGFSVTDCKHLLDCLYRLICHGVSPDTTNKWLESRVFYTSLPTVTNLQAAGVRFEGDHIGISEVRFKPGLSSAVLYLPKLPLDTTTERLWRNLVAHETVKGDRHEFMCFLELMDDLIDTQTDVGILRKGKSPVISHNFLGNDNNVAVMFNSLLQNCHTKRSPKWVNLRSEIDEYYNQKFVKLFYEFRETYLTKPWIAVSVIAAFSLLVLTFLQTFFTIKK